MNINFILNSSDVDPQRNRSSQGLSSISYPQCGTHAILSELLPEYARELKAHNLAERKNMLSSESFALGCALLQQGVDDAKMNSLHSLRKGSYKFPTSYKAHRDHLPSPISPPTPTNIDIATYTQTSPRTCQSTPDLTLGRMSLHTEEPGDPRTYSVSNLSPPALKAQSHVVVQLSNMSSGREDEEYQYKPDDDDDFVVGEERNDDDEERRAKPSKNAINYQNEPWGDVPPAYRCTFVHGCILESPNRKVVSHFFGRNKKCTLAMPWEVWATYCRRHYQRTRYRNLGKYGAQQMDLVRMTVKNLESWGGIAHYELSLRKRAAQSIKRENKYEKEYQNAIAAGHPVPLLVESTPCPERFLLPHLGKNKTAAEVLQFIDMMEHFVKENNCLPLEFEILPSYKPGRMKERSPPPKIRASTSRPNGVAKPAARRASTRASPMVARPKITYPKRSGRGQIARSQAARGRRTPMRRSSSGSF